MQNEVRATKEDDLMVDEMVNDGSQSDPEIC